MIYFKVRFIIKNILISIFYLITIIKPNYFQSIENVQEQYFLDRFKLDQIDTLFLSSISKNEPYVQTSIDQSTKITNINNSR